MYPVAAFLVVVVAVTGEVLVWAHRHDRTPHTVIPHAVTQQTHSQPSLTADLTSSTRRLPLSDPASHGRPL
jgi:hypothetical protein